MSQVVISKEQLIAARACTKDSYFDSPEWNGEALVYADWEASRERLLSTSRGTSQLSFLVAKGLVPMTREEFRAAITEKNRLVYEQIKGKGNV